MRVLCLLAFVLIGCGDRGPKTWPASGNVVFRNGQPVTSGIVEFAPVGLGPAARGSIDAKGHFVLKTGDILGAVADKHRVAIVQFGLRDGLSKSARDHAHIVPIVHPKYARFESSGIECKVEAGKDNVFTFEVISAN